MPKSMLEAVYEAAFGPGGKPEPKSETPSVTAAAPVIVAKPAAPARPAPEPTIAEAIIATWKADAAIRAEFRTFGAYSAWRMNQHAKATGQTVAQIEASAPDATGYIARLEQHGQTVTLSERRTIAGYAETWRASGDIRREFGRFEVFASYMTAKAAGRIRAIGK